MPKNFVMIVTLMIIAISGYKFIEGFDSEVSSVMSDIDNRHYLVLNRPNQRKVANELAKIRIRLESFVRHMNNKKDQIHSCGLSCKQAINRMYEQFKSVLLESKPESKFTSYTVNKGQKIFMCVRERKDGNNIIDENTLVFVALHELAHVMTKSIGHTKEFWDNFEFLLEHAVKDGFYKYHPYHQSPVPYCGTMISDTPFKI
jgi:hypothetical protein